MPGKHRLEAKGPPCLKPGEALSYTLEYRECRALWAHMMKVYRTHINEWYPPRRVAAMDWFEAKSPEVGGSLWICRALGLDYEAVMEGVERAYRDPTPADIKRYRAMNARAATMLRARKKRQYDKDSGIA